MNPSYNDDGFKCAKDGSSEICRKKRGGCEEEVQIVKITGRGAVVTGEDPGAVAPILQPVSTGVIAMNGW